MTLNRKFAATGLVAVMAGVAAFGLWAALSANHAASSATASLRRHHAFDDARYAVAQEESLERKYRLEPGPAVREAHRAAAEDFVRFLQEAADRGDAEDRALVAALATVHRRYIDGIERLFAAVDAGDRELADTIDATEIDPVFDEMQARAEDAATEHRGQAANALVELEDIQRSVIYLAPLVFGTALALVVLFWHFLRQRSVELGRAEQNALVKSEQRLRALVQNAADVILVLDKDARVTYASPSMASLLGYPAGETVGRDATALIAPEDRAHACLLFERAAGQPDATIAADLRWESAVGDVMVFETVVSNLLGDPSVGGVVVNCHEVTARRAAEDALRRSERLLQESQRAARIGSYELDFITGNWTSSQVLDEIFQIDGSDPHTVESWLDIIKPSMRADMSSYFASEVVGRRKPFDKEYAIVRRGDGRERWIHGMGDLEVDPGGTLVRMVGTIQDITERKEAEARLLQSQKMEGIGRLAGGIAHDFNNLLMGIIGYSELAASEVGPGTLAREEIDEAINAARRAAALTRQLLLFARQQIVEPRDVDLNEVVINLEKLLRRLIGEDIQLSCSVSEEVLVSRIDPGQFEQVIVNLVVNARDAMPDGGRLTIETLSVSPGATEAPIPDELDATRYAMVVISDTGTGIGADVIEHIFEPFFTTKEQGKGTGLGLATCFGIVKQAGGHIAVKSEPGRGTAFSIYLPLAHEAVASTEAVAPAGTRLPGTALPAEALPST